MGKKKYIKNSNGVSMSVTTDTLGLEKPLLNENYDIDVHNRNMDKIDEDLKPIDDSYIIELFQHDGDTTNPRDYYTKVEADEKFATKEDLNNIDLSNLATKEEANNALNKANEAFQRGDNVKTQLVDKLISEGLNVSTNNTFEELIGNIALGKKCASGSSTVSNATATFNHGVSSSKLCYIDIVLDFTPSIIVAITATSTNTRKYFSLYMLNMGICLMASFEIGGSHTNTNVYNIKIDNAVNLGNNKYRIPADSYLNNSDWVAFE